jgi:hypothetical protein
VPCRRSLRFEALEDRRLLATVDTVVDFLADDGFTTLREAISATPAGGTVNFAPSLTSGGPATINLSGLGQLTINKNITIQGPGADLLTINAFDPTPATNNGDGSRVLYINAPGLASVSISGLTLTGGDTTGGAAIFNSENLTLTASTISGNAAQFGGGGIYSGSGTSLTIASSTITGNVASLGGGISASGATLSITSSTFSGNTAASYGGGIFAQASSVTLISSTVSNNSGSYGGGVFSRVGRLTLTGSTVAANQAAISGGGIFSSSADLSLDHSTITGNLANSDNNATGLGGGLAIYGSGAHELDHMIVAANTRGAGGMRDDIFGALVARFSLVGDNIGATITNNGGNLIGTGASPIDPLLGPLVNTGGPTFTHGLLSGSPAIDMGDPAFSPPPTNDQRGASFVRVFDGDGSGGARIDIGAYERQPVAGFNFIVGTLADESDGNYSAGDLSLREAIGLAPVIIDAEIAFAPSLTSDGPATILLTSQIGIADSMTVSGPGASLLTIDASGSDPTPTVNDFNGSRVFYVANGTVELIGLTLTGGDDGFGGGAIVNTGNLSLVDSVIRDNAGRFRGGAILNDGAGTVSIVGSTISGNSTLGRGGGIFSLAGNVTLIDSVVNGNQAAVYSSVDYGGGGIFVRNGNLTITASTLSDNSVGPDFEQSYASGGGIYADNCDVTVAASTISGNSIMSYPGVFLNYGNGIHAVNCDVTMTNSTINNNFGVGGDESAISIRNGSLTLVNCTVSGHQSSGYAVLLRGSGQAFIRFSTISANEGGVLTQMPAMVQSSMIVGNDFDVDIDGAATLFQSEGYNMIGVGNAASAFNQPGDQTGITNPLLGALADNGGPTLTHALLPGSPAINAGDPSALAGAGDVPLYDQRGDPNGRVSGGRIDIGAFELQTAGPALPGDYNQNNVVDAADYTVWRNTLGASGLTPYAGADGDGDWMVDADDYGIWKLHFGDTIPQGAGSGGQGVQVATALAEPVAHVAEDPHPLAAALLPHPLDNSRPLPEGAAINAALAARVAPWLYDGTALLAANILTSRGSADFGELSRTGASPSRGCVASVVRDSPHDDALVAWLAESAGADRHRWNADFDNIEDSTGGLRRAQSSRASGTRADHGFLDGHCLGSRNAIFKLVESSV